MAITVPESISSSATAGERLLFRTLKTFLPDDYTVYFEPEIQVRRPDFVIIGPGLGLLVLEVKDYTRNTLFQLNHDEWHIVTTSGDQAVIKSPMKQARENMFHVVDVLKKDKNLIQLEGKCDFDFTNTAEMNVKNENIMVRNFHSWLKNDLRIHESQISKKLLALIIPTSGPIRLVLCGAIISTSRSLFTTLFLNIECSL
jgi:hypothetical protein